VNKANVYIMYAKKLIKTAMKKYERRWARRTLQVARRIHNKLRRALYYTTKTLRDVVRKCKFF
jgi:hypothetical protein